MDANDDIYVKGTHFNYFQMHTNFEQIYPKLAIVWGREKGPPNFNPGIDFLDYDLL